MQHSFILQAVYSIRKFLAVTLLLAFTIGVTPKFYFHELFANHTDYSCINNHSGKTQLTTYQFNCGFVNMEGISPFLEVQQIFSEPVAQAFDKSYPFIHLNNWIELRSNHTQHRGPPVLA